MQHRDGWNVASTEYPSSSRRAGFAAASACERRTRDDPARGWKVVAKPGDRVEAATDGCTNRAAQPGVLRSQNAPHRLRRGDGEAGSEAANAAGCRSTQRRPGEFAGGPGAGGAWKAGTRVHDDEPRPAQGSVAGSVAPAEGCSRRRGRAGNPHHDVQETIWGIGGDGP